MKITKSQIRSLIRGALIKESGEDDEVSGYDLWQQRLRDDPRPEDKETRDEERKRLGKASTVDTSPEAQKMVSDVLAFIEESNWGTPQQAGDANRYTVKPVREIEVDFLVKTRGERRQLLVKVLGTRDFVPNGGNYDAEDLGFLAENMGKIVEVLNALAESELPIHTFSVGTMR